jgi:hypothetical protein
MTEDDPNGPKHVGVLRYVINIQEVHSLEVVIYIYVLLSHPINLHSYMKGWSGRTWGYKVANGARVFLISLFKARAWKINIKGKQMKQSIF